MKALSESILYSRENRLYCPSCSRENFSTRVELDEHIRIQHWIGYHRTQKKVKVCQECGQEYNGIDPPARYCRNCRSRYAALHASAILHKFPMLDEITAQAIQREIAAFACTLMRKMLQQVKP